jgi:isopentenyl phosphate kinase
VAPPLDIDNVVLIKLGGSLLTDKEGVQADRPEVIARLAGELARAAAAQPAGSGSGLIVGHGSGSFGHVAAARHRLAGGLREPGQLPGMPATQQAAAALHRRVVAALAAAGALPWSLAPSSFLVAAAGRPAEVFLSPLLLALSRGLLPVVYGDVVLDQTQGAAICSTETLFAHLARALPGHGVRVRRILWLGETAGLLGRDGATVPRVTPADADAARAALGAARGTDVTGGMRHRLETALELAALGVPSLLLDGRVPGLLERTLLDPAETAGTLVTADFPAST